MSEKKKEAFRGKIEFVWFFIGAAAVLALGTIYLLLGQDALFVYHDQLDGEVIAYLLHARHLWDGSSVFPEFLNGAAKTALTMPSPASVLLFRLFDADLALAVMQVGGSLTGYTGMFLLLLWTASQSRTIREKHQLVGFLAMALGAMYAYLPFLPVYGLSQYGLPLLLYCFILLGERNRRIKDLRTIALHLYVIWFALHSSLVLVGFAVLGAGGVWLLISLVRRKFSANQGIAWGLLLLTYLAENFPLLTGLLSAQGGEVSHKTEYVARLTGFWENLYTYLVKGVQHGEDYHGLFFAIPLALAIFGLLFAKRRGLYHILAVLCGCNVLFVVLSALYNCEAGFALRSGIGLLKGFQANRILWLNPCLWYYALGCAVLILVEQWCGAEGQRKKRILNTGFLLLTAMVTLLTAGKILLASNLKPNVQKMINKNYSAMSFADYYAIGVLEQVQQYISENSGQKPEEYRVVSLGIDPAAALYHGFYCLDGYSNNYSLEYKHRFREIIAPELRKSQYLTDNFDGWGNRCYLFSAECPGYYTIQKGGFYFQNYEVDTESLKELGCVYLLSAAYIDNSEATGLELVRPEAFETEDSYYRIFLYRIL